MVPTNYLEKSSFLSYFGSFLQHFLSWYCENENEKKETGKETETQSWQLSHSQDPVATFSNHLAKNFRPGPRSLQSF